MPALDPQRQRSDIGASWSGLQEQIAPHPHTTVCAPRTGVMSDRRRAIASASGPPQPPCTDSARASARPAQQDEPRQGRRRAGTPLPAAPCPERGSAGQGALGRHRLRGLQCRDHRQRPARGVDGGIVRRKHPAHTPGARHPVRRAMIRNRKRGAALAPRPILASALRPGGVSLRCSGCGGP